MNLGGKMSAFETELRVNLDAAAEWATRNNMSASVVPPGPVVVVTDTLEIRSHANLAPTGCGKRCLRIVYDGPDGESAANPKPIVRHVGGYGNEFGRIEIVTRRRDAKNLVGLELVGLVNPWVGDLRIALLGRDCRGIVSRGRESLVVERVNVTATQPLVVAGGDNVTIRDVDLVAPTTPAAVDAMVGDLVPVPILLGMPHGVTIAGQNALHGGRQMLRVVAAADAATGNSLTIAGSIRYEQPLTDSVEPLIEFDLPGRALEMFCLSGVIRSSKRHSAAPWIAYTPGKIWRFEFPASHLFELGKPYNPPADAVNASRALAAVNERAAEFGRGN